MDLREELPSDRESVRDLHLRAFGDHGLVVADLVDTLRATLTPANGLSLVAEHEGQIVGHVMFTRSLLDAPRRLVEVQVLSPLAVVPERHKRGIGSALVRHGLRALAERAVPLVFRRAIRATTLVSDSPPVLTRAFENHPCVFPTVPSRPSGSRSTNHG
ncbi:GNAT family N-acetyltransferase [Streptomyces sp. GD-15H]|uniref:GNAT family N-acetyltransferase n=1 Tax=Streptomyces sp. GD-15H TaxID=3129112 RepID=UPI003872D217